MDSLTQVVLGGAVGHAAAGHTLGRRAALWGAVAGTIPDLDVLAYPFLDPAGELLFHRGVTHGLAFAFVAGPLLGYAVWRLAQWRAGAGAEVPPWRTYAAVFFWGLFTHPLLDVFTVYGTQLLAPFSNHPFAVASVFIIDPLVTLPLAAGLGVALWAGTKPWGRRAAIAGLTVAVGYLAWGVGAQAHVRGTVEAAYAERDGQPDRLLVAAGPLTTLWWRGLAERDGRVEPFSVHLLDGPEAVEFGPTMPFADLPPQVAQSRTGETLDWFSRGWLVRTASGPDSLVVADPRFGRLGEGADAPFVFSWTVETAPPFAFRQRPFAAAPDADLLRQIWGRIRLTRPEAAGPRGGERRTTYTASPDSPPP